mmetsp:Transcript_4908/g.12547  ORF Transcript_4908/g.12547 Transcript_4908/m.12547 type:complete len:362 (-) Transcript_4908:184-1269(-)
MATAGTTWLGVITSAVPMGLAFGTAMQNGLVILPETIRLQFTFQRYIMLKMFLAATISSCTSFAILSVLAPRTFQRAREVYFGCGSDKSLSAAAIGGAMLGAGMAIGGACPGMVIVQLGCGVPNAGYTFLGGLLGAATYGAFEPTFRKALHGPMKERKLEKMVGTSYTSLAIGFAALLVGVVGLIEYLVPWTSDLPVFATPWRSSWPPILAGAIIGSLQVPAVLGLGDTLGSSSAYMTVLAQALFSPSLEGAYKHITGFKRGADNWWQVVYLAASVAGSYLSSTHMGTFGAAQGLDPLTGVAGGFLMLFGSRVASGCTSGHGLSGMAMLSLPSIVAVCGMFGCAIAVGVTMSSLGVYRGFS